MSIAGDLGDGRLAAVLRLLYQQTKSGTLRIASEERVAAVLFRSGRIIGASGPKARRLGELLIGAGVIDEGLLDHALRRQRIERPRLTLGRILVAIGAATDDAIRKAVELQVQETITDVLTWERGSFEFIGHDIKPVDSISFGPGMVLPRVEMSTQSALVEATRALDARVRALDTSTAEEACVPAPSDSGGDPMRAGDWARVTASRSASADSMAPATVSDEIRNIGFYDSVEWADRSLHVQTEVIGRREAVVRSTVLEGGTVHYAERQPYPAGIADVEQARQHIEQQHRRVVDRASRGELENR